MTNIVRLKQGEARPSCSIYEVQEVEKPENFVIATMLRKVGKYKDKPRIVLQNKILFKCGFDFGTNIKLIPNNEGLVIKAFKSGNNGGQDTKLHVSKCLNHGTYLPTIDIKKSLEGFVIGSKVKINYYQDKIVILKEV